jgi:hypothetical protein
MKTRIVGAVVTAGCIALAVVAANAYGAIRGCGYAGGYSVSANSRTSCAFARNVAVAYSRGATNPRVYSPATGRYYRMYCARRARFVSCTGGNRAYVRLR